MSRNRDKRFDDTEIRSKFELRTELQVNQVELERQRRELKDAQQQLEDIRDRYADLYDYAPVGYLTLDRIGNIQTINQVGCAILGLEYTLVIDSPFVNYITEGSSHAYFNFLQQTFNSLNNAVVELKITNSFVNTEHIRLESSITENTDTCRVVMTDIGQLKETMFENSELLHENRRLMRNIFKIQEEERRILARELHDEYGQWLTAMHAEAETILNRSSKDCTVHACAQAIGECIKELHLITHSALLRLRPVLLDTLGLVETLLELKKQWCIHHNSITLSFKFKGKLDALGENLNITIYRIIQEALNNICNHAHATRASVNLSLETDMASTTKFLVLKVKDNGKGYSADELKRHGFGLLGMRERTIAMDGEFTISSAPDEGTQIYIKLPLNNLGKKRRFSDS